VNVFGGGLELYAADGTLIGVSGDASSADHIIAWKLRHAIASTTCRRAWRPAETT